MLRVVCNTTVKSNPTPQDGIKDKPAFVAFIGNTDSPNVQEEVGYPGERIVLEATALHLATCSAGGFSEPEFQVSERLDCGIAILHIELGALSCGGRGEWELLEHPEIARLRILGIHATIGEE